jgi:proton-dependent oligopeptide transporter, POT family
VLAVTSVELGNVFRLWNVTRTCPANPGRPLHVQPVAIALFARVAPPALKGMMLGVHFLSIYFGSLISGRLGAMYEHWSATNFWLLHASLVAAAGLLFPLFGRSLRRPRHGPLITPLVAAS